jgi:hypothetical protein
MPQIAGAFWQRRDNSNWDLQMLRRKGFGQAAALAMGTL